MLISISPCRRSQRFVSGIDLMDRTSSELPLIYLLSCCLLPSFPLVRDCVSQAGLKHNKQNLLNISVFNRQTGMIPEHCRRFSRPVGGGIVSLAASSGGNVAKNGVHHSSVYNMATSLLFFLVKRHLSNQR